MKEQWPRLMKLRTAARFVDEKPNDFVGKVGTVYPEPRKIPGLGLRWLRDDIDGWITRSTGERELVV